MSQRPPRHARILSTGACLPGPPLTNTDLEKYAGPLPEEVLEGIEVRTRHWIVDPATGEHHTGTSGMAAAAAQQALQRAGLCPDDIDLLVMSTASPEYLLPAAGTYVQDRLGLERCAVVEVRAGCVGAVQALDLARRYLSEGTCRRALVIGSESISPVLVPMYLGEDPQRVRMRDRLSLYTFGDGAGAVVLESVDGERVPGDDVFATECLGGGRKPGMRIVGGGTDAPLTVQRQRRRLMDLQLDVRGTAETGPRVFTAGLRAMLDRSGMRLAAFDACVLPEGNAEYFSSEMAAAGLTREDYALLQSRIVENLGAVGATGSAAVPLALDEGWTSGRILPGHRVMLMAIEASRYLYAGLTLTWRASTPILSAGPAGE